MVNETREKIHAVLKHYENCQLTGLKDVERQVQIYSEDSIFVVFPVPDLMGVGAPRVLTGKQAIIELFEQYNQSAAACDSVDIVHKHFMVDAEALKGSFAMEITMVKDGKQSQYFNSLQMQFNARMQVTLSLNWQADISGSDVLRHIAAVA
jgi:hypothetical protein